jgi:hypothetical protein
MLMKFQASIETQKVHEFNCDDRMQKISSFSYNKKRQFEIYQLAVQGLSIKQ